MKYILPIISLVLLFACSQKQSDIRIINLKNVHMSGEDSSYLRVPDGPCTLKIEKKELNLYLTLEQVKKAPVALERTPGFTADSFDAKGEPIFYLKFKPDFIVPEKEEKERLDFFNGKPGQKIIYRLSLVDAKDVELHEVMNSISSFEISEVMYNYDNKYTIPDTTIYKDPEIIEVKKFIALMQAEANTIDSVVTVNKGKLGRTRYKINERMETYKRIAKENRNKFTTDEWDKINKINEDYIVDLERIKNLRVVREGELYPLTW